MEHTSSRFGQALAVFGLQCATRGGFPRKCDRARPTKTSQSRQVGHESHGAPSATCGSSRGHGHPGGTCAIERQNKADGDASPADPSVVGRLLLAARRAGWWLIASAMLRRCKPTGVLGVGHEKELCAHDEDTMECLFVRSRESEFEDERQHARWAWQNLFFNRRASTQNQKHGSSVGLAVDTAVIRTDRLSVRWEFRDVNVVLFAVSAFCMDLGLFVVRTEKEEHVMEEH